MNIAPISNTSSSIAKNNNYKQKSNPSFEGQIFQAAREACYFYNNGTKTALKLEYFKGMADLKKFLGGNYKKYSDKLYNLLLKNGDHNSPMILDMYYLIMSDKKFARLFKYPKSEEGMCNLLRASSECSYPDSVNGMPLKNDKFTLLGRLISRSHNDIVDKITENISAENLDKLFLEKDGNGNIPLMYVNGSIPIETLSALSYNAIHDMATACENKWGNTVLFNPILVPYFAERLTPNSLYQGLLHQNNEGNTPLHEANCALTYTMTSKLRDEDIGNICLKQNNNGYTVFHQPSESSDYRIYRDTLDKLNNLQIRLTPERREKIFFTEDKSGNYPVAYKLFANKIFPSFTKNMPYETILKGISHKNQAGDNALNETNYAYLEKYINDNDLETLLLDTNNEGIPTIHRLSTRDHLYSIMNRRFKNNPDTVYRLMSAENNDCDTLLHNKDIDSSAMNALAYSVREILPSDKLKKLLLNTNNKCQKVIDVLPEEILEIYLNYLSVNDSKEVLQVKDSFDRTICHKFKNINTAENVLYKIAKDDYNNGHYELPSVTQILNQEDKFGQKTFSDAERKAILYSLCNRIAQ